MTITTHDLTYGACPYCGQMVDIGRRNIADSSGDPALLAEIAAAAVCSCPQAYAEREIKVRIESARIELLELVGVEESAGGLTSAESRHVDLLLHCVECVAHGTVSAASVTDIGGGSYKITRTKLGKVSVILTRKSQDGFEA